MVRDRDRIAGDVNPEQAITRQRGRRGIVHAAGAAPAGRRCRTTVALLPRLPRDQDFPSFTKPVMLSRCGASATPARAAARGVAAHCAAGGTPFGLMAADQTEG